MVTWLHYLDARLRSSDNICTSFHRFHFESAKISGKFNSILLFGLRMFSFDGQYKTRRVVSLGGASKKVFLYRFIKLCRNVTVELNMM